MKRNPLRLNQETGLVEPSREKGVIRLRRHHATPPPPQPELGLGHHSTASGNSNKSVGLVSLSIESAAEYVSLSTWVSLKRHACRPTPATLLDISARSAELRHVTERWPSGAKS